VYIVAQCRKSVMKLSILRQTIKYLLLPGNYTKENMMLQTSTTLLKMCYVGLYMNFMTRGNPTASKLRKIMEEKIGFSGSVFNIKENGFQRTFYKFCGSLPLLRHKLYREVRQPLRTDKTRKCRKFNRSVILDHITYC
jgi:hypothetical protein